VPSRCRCGTASRAAESLFLTVIPPHDAHYKVHRVPDAYYDKDYQSWRFEVQYGAFLLFFLPSECQQWHCKAGKRPWPHQWLNLAAIQPTNRPLWMYLRQDAQCDIRKPPSVQRWIRGKCMGLLVGSHCLQRPAITTKSPHAQGRPRPLPPVATPARANQSCKRVSPAQRASAGNGATKKGVEAAAQTAEHFRRERY
jgi:hypothetical protein